jgi:adenosylcobyric acid synthase
VLDVEDAPMVAGFLINKFRGDPGLFAKGRKQLGALTGWRDFGLVPHLASLARLPAEDTLGLSPLGGPTLGGRMRVVVLAYPHIANFDDFDPLRLEPDVDLRLLAAGEPIPGDADLVILPGSKATIADLKALRRCGWDIDVAAHVRRGGMVLGICGGYQMLGTRVADPHGIEGAPGSCEGLGLLDVATELTGNKLLREVSGHDVAEGIELRGYEMHVGVTTGKDCQRPLVRFADGRNDGAVSGDGRVSGCYVHGLFAHDAQREAWMRCIGARGGAL